MTHIMESESGLVVVDKSGDGINDSVALDIIRLGLKPAAFGELGGPGNIIRTFICDVERCDLRPLRSSVSGLLLLRFL